MAVQRLRTLSIAVSLLILLCLPALPLQAQDGRLSIGSHAGVNFSTVELGSDFSLLGHSGSLQRGFNGSFFANYRFPDSSCLSMPGGEIPHYFTLQAELRYSQQGYQGEDLRTYEQQDLSFNVRNTYIQLPLLVQSRFKLGDVTILSHVGAYVGYWAGSKNFGQANALGRLQRTQQDLDLSRPVYRRWDIGMVTGLGASFDLGKGNMLFELRTVDGKLSVINKSELEVSRAKEPQYENYSVGVLVGYEYPLGGQ
jgi:hypothetical protein